MSERIGYVVKVYPRFSETFIVTEILAREAAGEQLDIFALRPTTDTRFHPELARVQAPVTFIAKPHKLTDGWQAMATAHAEIPRFAERFARLMPVTSTLEGDDVTQAVLLAIEVHRRGLRHLHAHFASLAGQTAALAAGLAGITYSVTTHAKDLFHESVVLDRLRFIIDGAAFTVAVSEYNARFLARTLPGAGCVELVRNGLELDRFPFREPGPLGTPRRILAVGRLVEKKGFSLLIDAVRRLVSEGVPVDARIAGDGDLRPELSMQIARLGLEDHVQLLGPRSQREITDLLRWADVMAAPCVVGLDGNADGLPTVILEAMATGLPCVASDVTGIGEAIQNGGSGQPRTGVLIEPGSVDTLVDGLRLAMAPDFDRAAVARNARALIEAEFDASKQAWLLGHHTRIPVPTGDTDPTGAAEEVVVA